MTDLDLKSAWLVKQAIIHALLQTIAKLQGEETPLQREPLSTVVEPAYEAVINYEAVNPVLANCTITKDSTLISDIP